MPDAVDLLADDFGLTDREFEAFATHGLDQHGEVQETTARDFISVAVFVCFNPKGHVRTQLFDQPVVDVAACQEGAFTDQRRIVHAEDHGKCGFVHSNSGQGDWIFEICDGVADGDIFEADQGNDIASTSGFHFKATELVEDQNLVDGVRHTMVIFEHQ